MGGQVHARVVHAWCMLHMSADAHLLGQNQRAVERSVKVEGS